MKQPRNDRDEIVGPRPTRAGRTALLLLTMAISALVAACAASPSAGGADEPGPGAPPTPQTSSEPIPAPGDVEATPDNDIASTPEGNVYVAPDGNDANSGTEASPLLTFKGARDRVRELRNLSGDITVWFRGGSYSFSETVVLDQRDGGSGDQLVTYRAYPEETPVFSSLTALSGWTRFTDEIVVAPLPDGVDHVRFLYDEAADWLPRSSSDVFLATEPSSVDDGCLECNWDVAEAQDARSNVAYPPTFDTPDWAFADQYDLRQSTISWVQEILPIERVDTSDRRIFTQIPAGLEMRLNFEEAENLNRNWVLNSIEGIDEPGEWASIDGAIYLYPVGGTDGIAVPKLTELILVDGGPDDGNAEIASPVEYLRFDGLTCRGGDFYAMTAQDITVQHDWSVVDAPTALLRFRNVANIEVVDSVFEKSGSTGLRFDRYAQNNLVRGNRFSYLGREAIVFSGRGPGYGDVNRSNEIAFNQINNTGMEKWAAPAVVIDQSSGNRIHHNLIRDTQFTSIVLTAPRQLAFASLFGGPTGYLGREFHYNEISPDVVEIVQAAEDEELGSYEAMNFVYNYDNQVYNNVLIDVSQGAGYLVNGYVYNSGVKRGGSNSIDYNYIRDTGNDQVNNAVFYSDSDQDMSTYVGNMISGVQNGDDQFEPFPLILAFALYAEGEFNEGTEIVIHGNAIVDSTYPVLIDGVNFDEAGTISDLDPTGDPRFEDVYRTMVAFLDAIQNDFDQEVPGVEAMRGLVGSAIED